MPHTLLIGAHAGRLALTALLLSPLPAGAQVHYAGTLQAGSAFIVDLDAPEPPGSFSISGTLERRYGDRIFSVGLEGGFHRFVSIRQHLVSGPLSATWDRTNREAWRLTPYVRGGTRGTKLRLYAQTGLGLYLHRVSHSQRWLDKGIITLVDDLSVSDVRGGLHFGLGLELFPGLGALGIGLGLRSHTVLRADDFNTAELGLVYRVRR